MSEIDSGGPAFPTSEDAAHFPGLTKREWFAGMALQGLCANPNIIGWTENKGSGYKLDNGHEREQLVFRSFMVADAMLRVGKGE